jgi:isovaleryl-CoA dehydrogenase
MPGLDAAALSRVIAEVIEPQAVTVDRDGLFPRASIDALAGAGFLGLLSAQEVGGGGKGMRDAAQVVEQVGTACGSTAMVLTMHYVGVSAIEAHGPRPLREEIGHNKHLTTLALSEAGSRSHFWVPIGTATAHGNDQARLNAQKSFATSAGHADSYVWSSKPLAVEGLSTLWIMPGKAPGLRACA